MKKIIRLYKSRPNDNLEQLINPIRNRAMYMDIMMETALKTS